MACVGGDNDGDDGGDDVGGGGGVAGSSAVHVDDLPVPPAVVILPVVVVAAFASSSSFAAFAVSLAATSFVLHLLLRCSPVWRLWVLGPRGALKPFVPKALTLETLNGNGPISTANLNPTISNGIQ